MGFVLLSSLKLPIDRRRCRWAEFNCPSGRKGVFEQILVGDQANGQH